MLKKFIIVTLFPVSCLQILCAQDSLDTYQLDQEIFITANRIPTLFSDVARTVTVINRLEIEKIPAQSVAELLENVSGVDVQQRGTQGIQADISLRGAGFNQTLILLNGLKLSDPQTGHHNMNLPVEISEIERIEILKGPGSRLYGPNAFGGVINIITKESSRLNAAIGGLYGEYNLYNSYFNLSLPMTQSSHRFSISKMGSDGHKYNTDLHAFTLSHSSNINVGSVSLNLATGFNEKHFGANNFYIPVFPNPEQYEETKATLIKGGLKYSSEVFSLKQQLYFRNHQDTYYWNRFTSTPNKHDSKTWGSETSAQLNSIYGISSLGFEVINEMLESNSLGIAGTENSSGLFEHKRNTLGIFFQHQFTLNPLVFSLGGSLYKYSDQKWQGWPGIDVLFKINNNAKIYGSYSEGFRIPTYTNLYLNFPAAANPYVAAIGNPDLKNERSQSYELGYAYKSTRISAELAVFQRNDKNLIDYVLNETDSIYTAQNFTKISTAGLDANLKIINPFKNVNSIFANYAFLDLDVDLFGKNTLYILSHFKQQFIFGFDYNMAGLHALSNHWKLKYEERLNGSTRTTIDTRLSLKMENTRLFLDITNILDEKYEDITGVTAPGRWLKLGFEYNLIK